MGHYTYYNLEEASSVNEIKTDEKYKKAQHIYNNMLIDLEKIGIHTPDVNIPINPFKSQNLYKEIISYMKLNFDYSFDDNGQIHATWYEHEEDMKKVSLHFPNVLIKTHGEYDEDEIYVWDSWFLNGKSYKGEYTLQPPKFNLSMLE